MHLDHEYQQGYCVPALGTSRRYFSAVRSSFFGALLILVFLTTTARPGQSISLIWAPSTTPGIVGYNIYYGGASGKYTNKVTVGLVTNVTISGLVGGATYYLVATAYNSAGFESPFSNEVFRNVPNLPGLKIMSAPARQFVLTVTGLAGHIYEIQATQDFKKWTTIATVTMAAGGLLSFTDMNASSFTQRFYRIQTIATD